MPSSGPYEKLSLSSLHSNAPFVAMVTKKVKRKFAAVVAASKHETDIRDCAIAPNLLSVQMLGITDSSCCFL